MELKIANAAPIDIEVVPAYNSSPPLAGATMSIPNKLTIPKSGQVTFTAQIAVGKSVAPGVFNIQFTFER